MKEGAISPPPLSHNKRDTFAPPTLLGRCDLSQFIL